MEELIIPENTPDKLVPVQAVPVLKIDQKFIESRPLSYSSLKHFQDSPKHYIEYLTKKWTDTEATILGNLVELLVYIPERFDDKFILVVKPNLRTNKGKRENLELLQKCSDKKIIPISMEMLKTAMTCKESLMSHNECREFIERTTKTQVKLYWRHKPTNLPNIGYVDAESRAFGEDWACDLKTGASTDPDEFVRSAAKFRYHLQVGSYLNGYRALQFRFPNFAFITVETVSPYNANVFYCPAKYVERAKAEYLGSLMAFRKCMNEQMFHLGYEFRLMGTRPYFSMEIPRYIKPVYEGYDFDLSTDINAVK
ncbi:MAG: PD-(D/E)XK nuclease-like domain-containing protein [Bacteroidales bacterium]